MKTETKPPVHVARVHRPISSASRPRTRIRPSGSDSFARVRISRGSSDAPASLGSAVSALLHTPALIGATGLAAMRHSLKLPGLIGASLSTLVSDDTDAGRDRSPKSLGGKVRRFVRDVAHASMADEPEERAARVRSALARCPEVVAYIAEGKDVSALIEAADIPMGKANATERLQHAIRDELLGQLGDLMVAVPGQNLVPQALRDAIHHVAGDVLGLSEMAVKPIGPVAAKLFLGLGVRQREDVLEFLGDAPFLRIAGALEGATRDAKISEFPALKLLLDPTQGIDLTQFVPASKVELFHGLLVRYYDRLSVQDKKRIASALLALPPNSPLEKQLSAVVQSSGPVVQKLFQLIARDVKSDLVQAVLEDMHSNVKPCPPKLARKAIEAELGGKKIEDLFTDFDESPLGSATVGQTHRARWKKTGEAVVIKFIKPGVREAAMREIETLRSIIGPTEFERELADNIEESLMQEFDLRLEAENLDEAEHLYTNSRRGITVAKRVKDAPVTQNLLVQEEARGTQMSKLPTPQDIVRKYDRVRAEKELIQRGTAMMRLLEQWGEVALFNPRGFFHADLHPGNRFLTTSPRSKEGHLVTIIDTGSKGRLTVELQRGFTNVALLVWSKTPAEALKALSTIAKVPDHSKEALLSDLTELYRHNYDIVERINKTLRAAVDRDLIIHKQLGRFARGYAFIAEEITKINLALKTVNPSRKVVQFDPEKVFTRVGTRHAVMETPFKLLRLAPKFVREPVFAFAGMDSDEKLSNEVFTLDTLGSFVKANVRRALGKTG